MGMELPHSAMSKWVVCPHCGNEDAGAFTRKVCGTTRLMGMMCSDCNTKEYWNTGEVGESNPRENRT